MLAGMPQPPHTRAAMLSTVLACGEDVGRRPPTIEQGSADAEYGFGGGQVVCHRLGFRAEVEALQGGHGAAVGPGDAASGVEIENGDALRGAFADSGCGFLDGSLLEAWRVVGQMMGGETKP